MKITYKIHHAYQAWIHHPVARVLESIDSYLWDRAHYKNGNGAHLNVQPRSMLDCWRNSGEPF